MLDLNRFHNSRVSSRICMNVYDFHPLSLNRERALRPAEGDFGGIIELLQICNEFFLNFLDLIREFRVIFGHFLDWDWFSQTLNWENNQTWSVLWGTYHHDFFLIRNWRAPTPIWNHNWCPQSSRKFLQGLASQNAGKSRVSKVIHWNQICALFNGYFDETFSLSNQNLFSIRVDHEHFGNSSNNHCSGSPIETNVDFRAWLDHSSYLLIKRTKFSLVAGSHPIQVMNYSNDVIQDKVVHITRGKKNSHA